MLVISKIPYWQVYILSPFLLFCLNGLLKTTSSPVLDFGLFLPYGVLHYLSPFILTLYCLYREELHVAKSYLHGLGWMNVFGVITQVLLPCAPPWYNLKYGVITADYSMPGDPGGLSNVDKLFNSNLFTSMFNSSPLVFGAMPSLHSGMAVIVTLFAFSFSKKFGALMCCYVVWIWMATIYFNHHYLIDLLVGMVYACIAYRVFNKHSANFLPLYSDELMVK
jgi:membrane-associated phospholipid phosphatase